MHSQTSASVSAALFQLVREAIDGNGGWLPFDRFMALALYAPGLGYYANSSRKFGRMPASGSDFVTAPELSPLFGRTLARQVEQALAGSATDEIWEFGAGSGALALQLLGALPAGRVERYTIVDVSGALRERQRQTLREHLATVRWVDVLPEVINGVIVGNEVLDAMPVQLLHFDGRQWFERGVAATDAGFTWCDRATALRPDHEGPFVPGTTTELHLQAQAFVATLAERLQRGAAFFIDYGFPAAEYYHPQRMGGTLMCHRAHRADADPLADVGDKDITAHVNFSGVALTAQDAGCEVLGYTTQGSFLINCGLPELLGATVDAVSANTAARAQMLLAEHEMGELFKVIGFAKGCDTAFVGDPLGFARGDRSHTL